MEVILITNNLKYQSLVSTTKTQQIGLSIRIESPNVDILAVIDTQVFLNHHYDISFYCLKDNFSYQLHLPLKVSKQLLDRNEGPVSLTINHVGPLKIQSETDLMEIFSKVQESLNQPYFDPQITFSFEFWEIKIKIILVSQSPAQEQKLKEIVLANSSASKVHKLILNINDDNYEQFLRWSENESEFFDYEKNNKLSKQYISLKQQIENEKNCFRNKIKTVEAILGENINIEKLLCDEKEQNAEFKRLKQTFETIKNSDIVLLEQERKVQIFRQELKSRIMIKHSLHYEKAKLFGKKKAEIASLSKCIQELKYRLECVSKSASSYTDKKVFAVSPFIKKMLNTEIEKFKQIGSIDGAAKRVKKINLASAQKLNKNTLSFSLHQNENRKQDEQLKMLRRKVAVQKQQAQQQKKLLSGNALDEEIKAHEKLLLLMFQYCSQNAGLLKKIEERICSQSAKSNAKDRIKQIISNSNTQVLTNSRQFYVLAELLEQSKAGSGNRQEGQKGIPSIKRKLLKSIVTLDENQKTNELNSSEDGEYDENKQNAGELSIGLRQKKMVR